ncbi:adenosylcobinamide-GDP ribazoletransferase [Intrasporangium mesophilum]
MSANDAPGDQPGRLLTNGCRLAFGTFTALPVGHPRRADVRTFGTAMLLAPATTGPALVSWVALGLLATHGVLPGLVAGALALAIIALLSRALHLDGLADLADGLTAGHDPERSLAVMRKGDVGPAGMAVLVLVLLLDAACLSGLLVDHAGITLAGSALLASRLAPAICARSGIPAARPEGLGQAVAGSVSRKAVVTQVVVVCLLAGAVGWLTVPAANPAGHLRAAAAGVIVVLAGVVGAVAVRRRAVRRLRGITGDVIGAAMEIALAVALVTATVVNGLWGQ